MYPLGNPEVRPLSRNAPCAPVSAPQKVLLKMILINDIATRRALGHHSRMSLLCSSVSWAFARSDIAAAKSVCCFKCWIAACTYPRSVRVNWCRVR